MTNYFVRKTGSDAAAGTSAGAAWLTVDKAANTVAAGDTVYIGAGLYRELVTMDTSGTSGSVISYIADIDGSQTGDAGLVFVTAHDDDAAVATRTMCLDMGQKDFIVWRYVQFIGGTAQAAGNTAGAGHVAYEGCRFDFCLFQSSKTGAHAFRIEINNGVTPTTDGLTMNGCRFLGSAKVEWDSQASAIVNLKWLLENCMFFVVRTSGADYGFDIRRITNGGSFGIGGVSIGQCLFWSYLEAIYFEGFNNTTDISYVRNCRFVACNYCVDSVSATSGSVIIERCIASTCANTVFGNVTWPLSSPTDSLFVFAGIHDFPFSSVFGYSPYGHPYTPLASDVLTDPAVDFGTNYALVGVGDAYGNSRQMGGIGTGFIYVFDGSTVAISDPDAVWTTEENALTVSLVDEAYTTTTGDADNNEIYAGGTNSPASGDTITSVNFRSRGYSTTGVPVGNVTIYTAALAEELGNITFTNSTMDWTAWTALSAPSGGWTWADVQALEFKAWRVSGATFVSLTLVEVQVLTAATVVDVSPVEARSIPDRSATWAKTGTYSMSLTGTGYQEFLRPVAAVSTTITVWARKDSSYAGTAPKLEVLIGNTSQGTDSLSVGADTDEQLSVNFTPSVAGWCRIRLYGYATAGECFFDDLEVA